MTAHIQKFDRLVQEALAQDFSGWDFSYLRGRHEDSPLPWEYRQYVLDKLPSATRLLDMGTGGGEFLAALPLPAITYATEAHPPNVPIATNRLEPLGVRVVAITDDATLPFDDGQFDLIINRHEAYSEDEVFRLLSPGGFFLTQQVGGDNEFELNQFLTGHVPEHRTQHLSASVARLEEAGFQVVTQHEAFPPAYFYDIGAVVYYLKVISWQIEDFSVERYRDQLLTLHQHIQGYGSFRTTEHRFYIEAVKARKHASFTK